MTKLISKYLNAGSIKYTKESNLPEVTVTAIDPNITKKGSELYNYIRGVNSMRNTLMQDYGFSDDKYANLSKLAVNLAGRESSYGHGFSYNFRKLIPDPLIRLGHRITRGLVQPISRGMSQIKFFRGEHPVFNPNFHNYGLNEVNVKNNNKNQGKATMVYLSYLDKVLPKSIHWSDGTLMSDTDKRSIAFHLGKIPTDYLNDKNSKSQNSATYVKKYNLMRLIK